MLSFLNNDNFKMEIVGGVKQPNNYVQMKNGQNYKIRLQNNTSKRCQVKLDVDGNNIGTFVLNAYQVSEIERPVDREKKLTFFLSSQDKFNPSQTGISSGDKNNGLIEATFISEVRPKYRSSGIKYQSRSFGAKCANSSYQSFSCDEEDEELDCCLMSGSGNYAEGGTGLKGKSDQHFTTVSGFSLDYKTQSTLRVRLVGSKMDLDYVPKIDDFFPEPLYNNPEPLNRKKNVPPPPPVGQSKWRHSNDNWITGIDYTDDEWEIEQTNEKCLSY